MTKYFICLHFESCQLHNFRLKQEKFPKDFMCQISYRSPLKESIKGYRSYLTVTLYFLLHVHSHVRFTYTSTGSQIIFTSPGPLWMKSNLIFCACYMALASSGFPVLNSLIAGKALGSLQELQGRETNCGLEYIF